ncbi:MAG: DUF4387 family protein [Pseudomonadota bacterium]
MPRLRDLARLRSKNAGPFWITIDLFCDGESYARVAAVATEVFSARLGVGDVRRFDMPDLHVVKLSLPRPQVQGSLQDRDMHGASLVEVLADMEVG